MLSPSRAIFAPCASAQAQAARAQAPRRCCTPGSCQWPTTTVRSLRSREQMNPNSRPPWADWFRFMKSMSMPAQGMSRPNWVCRWQKGLRRAPRPAIHIRAGEKVCIQQTRPTQAGAALASTMSWVTASGVVRVGLGTTRQGRAAEASRAAAIAFALRATWARVSSPYRCWLPVMNQISLFVESCMPFTFHKKKATPPDPGSGSRGMDPSPGPKNARPDPAPASMHIHHIAGSLSPLWRPRAPSVGPTDQVSRHGLTFSHAPPSCRALI